MLDRSGGQGHEKPFGYYFSLLWGGTMTGRPADIGFSPQGWAWALGIDPDARRMVLTEGALIVLAVIGCLSAFGAKPERNQSNHLVRFLAVYSVATFVIYSLIAYKTPWCIMGAWHGLLIMAGLGAEGLVKMFWNVWGQRVMMTILGLVSLHLGLQAWRMSRDFARESRNPYNYSMTSPDTLAWVDKFHRFAQLHPDGYGLSIVQRDYQGGWPLPWYLSRQFTNYRWQEDKTGVDINNTTVLLQSSAAEEELRLLLREAGETEAFDEMFVAENLTLHPSGSLRVYVRRDLWQQYLDRQPWPPLAVQQ
jgi:predicted membrane-bound mannosyltransferase